MNHMLNQQITSAIISVMVIFGNIARAETSSPRIANFNGVNISHGMTRENLDFISKYALIVTNFTTDGLEKEISYIKSKNPKILILQYISVRDLAAEEKKMCDELWMHDLSGKLISTWPGRYLPNQTREEVNKIIVDRARDKLAIVPQLDGFFLDGFTQSISYIRQGQIDADGNGRATNTIELDRRWAAGLIRIVKGIRGIRPNIIIMANGWAPLEFGYEVLNGVLFEDQLSRLETSGPTSSAFADSLLEAYQKWMKISIRPHVTAFVDGGGKIQDAWKWKELSNASRSILIAEAKQNLKKMRFNLCFSLMADGYAGFDYGTVWRGQHWWFSDWGIDLGNPIGSMRRGDGYWYRTYDNAVVYVNPYQKAVHVSYEKNKYTLQPFDGLIVEKLHHRNSRF